MTKSKIQIELEQDVTALLNTVTSDGCAEWLGRLLARTAKALSTSNQGFVAWELCLEGHSGTWTPWKLQRMAYNMLVLNGNDHVHSLWTAWYSEISTGMTGVSDGTDEPTLVLYDF